MPRLKNQKQMKTKLLALLFAAGLMMNLSAQTVFQSSIESWGGTPLNPTDWMGAKTSIPDDSVQQNTTTPYHGTYCAKLVNTSSTHERFSTQVVPIVQGKAYLVSYSARGRGSIRAGLFTDMNNAGFGYLYSSYQSVNSTNWFRFKQSVLADTTNSTTAEFILSVKSTIAANGHLDVDSVSIVEYTPPAGVSLYTIQYTQSANGKSPYYGMIVQDFGGIATATYASGYYLQTSGSNKWAGLLVYDPTNAANVAIGDSIKITAGIDEYYYMTEATGVTAFQKVSSGNPLPAPAVLGTTDNVNQEMYESILVQVTGPYVNASWSSTTHEWMLDDGSGSATIDNQIYDAFPTAAPPAGNYQVTGPVNYQFSAFSVEPRTSADVVNVSGIGQYGNSLSATVYPSPVAGELTIKLPFSAKSASVKLFDAIGNEVLSVSASGDMISLKNLEVPAGIYMVKVVADSKVSVTKVVKQ
jgi:hypothetical protein